jgi:hypothetical protein
LNPQQVPIVKDKYEFFIRQNVFDNDLDSAFSVIGHIKF